MVVAIGMVLAPAVSAIEPTPDQVQALVGLYDTKIVQVKTKIEQLKKDLAAAEKDKPPKYVGKIGKNRKADLADAKSEQARRIEWAEQDLERAVEELKLWQTGQLPPAAPHQRHQAGRPRRSGDRRHRHAGQPGRGVAGRGQVALDAVLTRHDEVRAGS